MQLLLITILGHEWGNVPWVSPVLSIIFTSDEVISLANRMASDQESLFTVECFILFLTRCCKGRYFLTRHCHVTIVDLWRHANIGYWHCDVLFVDCTSKLAQMWSSLVSNNREYRFRTTNLIARFMRTRWDPSGADRTQVGPMLAPWILLSGPVFTAQRVRYLC